MPLTAQHRSRTVSAVCSWYADNRRDLPWRQPHATAWQVMVSEFMLQQTPVARVLEPWRRWVERWPEPADLAAAPSGEAIRAWGRLGYPRRALRLHAAAVAICADHGGEVPSDYADLLALPGVGDYTAAAIASFAFGQRQLVLDTNIRRVIARVDSGEAAPPASPTVAERERAAAWLPQQAKRAATWAAASMELGAVVCTARAPRCTDCPIQRRCRWFAAGRPAAVALTRKQSYEGTDRQCRGALLAEVRAADGAVAVDEVLLVWPDRKQAERAWMSLIADGLVTVRADNSAALPG